MDDQRKQYASKNSVLIVDDAKNNLDILNSILEPDYTVYMADSGRAALESVNENDPDIILLDIIMPYIDGFDVLRILKNNEKTKNIPVIIISGLEDPGSEESGLDLGASDYIHKPFSSKIVKLKVRNQLKIVNQIRTIEQYAYEKGLAISKMLKLQKELELSIEDAQNANNAKSSFLARMSHEIRTPLNAVIGISEIQLQNNNLAPDVREALIRINNSGDLLLSIINDILDISRIEAGMLELSHEKYDISRMINDTVYLNTIKHEEKPVEFILNVDENVPSEVIGDETRVKQILNNLLSNAFKYTQAGKVELSLNAEKNPDDDKLIVLVFRVRDTGQGMTEEQLNKIFDDYSRFNLDINRAIAGTGLGMGITQNLIHLLNGEIHAESKKDSGSLFTVRIPQGYVNAQVLGKETVEKLRQFRNNFSASERRIKITREPIPFGKVLVVDDIVMNLYVTGGLLSPYGLKVDTAVSGFEAIEKIKESQKSNNLYDLVFMDQIMPGLDGIETTKRIREMGSAYEKLPIIMLTANAFTDKKNNLQDDGFNGFLLKPVNIKELDAILKKWISPKKIINTDDNNHTETETTEAQKKFFKALGNIGEINIEAGLSSVAGKKDKYRETLEIFLGKLEFEVSKMSDFLEKKDLHAFLISVHSMKSMLAIIGASKLSETAYELQTALSNQDIENCKLKFEEFKIKMTLLRDKLSDLFSAVRGDAVSEIPPQSEQSSARDAYKVLIVEDTEMILNVLKFEFEEYGLKADTAASGAQAIEKTAENVYDIIFMDYHMPEMDGIETTAIIRKREAETKTKPNIIIALTGDIDPNKKKMFMNNGFNGVLSKPVVKSELEEILKMADCTL